MSVKAPCGGVGVTTYLNISAKRVNFISIQHSHGIGCKEYRQSPVRTGYEQVIAQRTTGDMFAYAARDDGKVVSVSETGIVVEYKNGKKKGLPLGRMFGTAAGLTVPHELITTFKVGQSFKKGAVLTYNDSFFEPDWMNPGNVVWKSSILVKTVLLESTQTLEDSSSISKAIAAKLVTPVTKPRTLVVSFDQVVHRLVKVGDTVTAESILCVIEDAVTAQSGLFDESDLDTLRVLDAKSPQAKAPGVVERIEVFYHGDKEDMSASLRQIANMGDRERAARLKAIDEPVITGESDEGFRIEGDPLLLNTMAIRILITSEVNAGVGDKGVFGNQMKTVFGSVMEQVWTTETGEEIGAVFGRKSINDRIVLSPDLIGTTNTLLDVIGKQAVAMYRGK